MDETILAMLHELQEARRGTEDNLPAMMPLSRYREAPPQPEELIEGILRRGHKMLISGGSKAGKSFLLMELCVAIAEGGLWLDTFRYRKGRVLYVNLEIDHASAVILAPCQNAVSFLGADTFFVLSNYFPFRRFLESLLFESYR